MHDPVEHENSYVIVDRGETDTESGEPLYWSNEDGWGDFKSCTIFTEAETLTLMLPIGNQVEWVAFWDAVPKKQPA